MKRIRKFFSDFKAFISRGNIVDLAIGVIIGSAFSAIVTAFTNKIIMPLVNWAIAAITGGKGVEGAYTFLKKVVDPTTKIVNLDASIYIDWGAFITAILNFLIIAFVLFLIMKALMATQGFTAKIKEGKPTREERKTLKEQGVNMRDFEAVKKATLELREKNKPAPEPAKPTQEELLTGILEELKKQNALEAEKPATKTAPAKQTKTTQTRTAKK